MTLPELLDLPVSFPLDIANRALSLRRSTGYEFAKRGTYPVRVLRAGRAYRVSHSDLLPGGGDLHTIKETLPHTTITLTSDTYASLLPQVDREVAEKAARIVPRSRRADDARNFAPVSLPLPADTTRQAPPARSAKPARERKPAGKNVPPVKGRSGPCGVLVQHIPEACLGSCGTGSQDIPD